MIKYSLIIFILLLTTACKKEIKTVSVQDFTTFVEETGYITDAEKFGWSIVQTTVFDFEVKEKIDWRNPNGSEEAKENYAVTQVSYNDALAYAEWANVRIPSYDEYWSLVQNDQRPINQNAPQILAIENVNIVGNVWDLTRPDKLGRVRLAGGSYLCNKNSCNGTSQDRILHVDMITGNTHIGFSVIE